MSAPEIERIAVSLVRSHYDEELAFKDEAKRLAEYFDDIGRTQVAEYVIAMAHPSLAFSTMEVDPLPRIARDMFAVIEEKLGESHPKVAEFRQRLGQYMPDFCARVERGESCHAVSWGLNEDAEWEIKLSCGHSVYDEEPDFCPKCGARVVES